MVIYIVVFSFGYGYFDVIVGDINLLDVYQGIFYYFQVYGGMSFVVIEYYVCLYVYFFIFI